MRTADPTPRTAVDTAAAAAPPLRVRLAAVAVILALLALVIAAVLVPGLRGKVQAATTYLTPSAPFTPTSDDGYIPDGESVALWDERVPAITQLDPDLLAAMRGAADAAAADGHEVVVTSGWRSRAYQQWLFDKAVRHYGDADVARQWVASPDESSHVSGDAIDIGPWDATLWMQTHSPEFGLCQIYANEMWHYELAARHGGACPELRDSAAG